MNRDERNKSIQTFNDISPLGLLLRDFKITILIDNTLIINRNSIMTTFNCIIHN